MAEGTKAIANKKPRAPAKRKDKTIQKDTRTPDNEKAAELAGSGPQVVVNIPSDDNSGNQIPAKEERVRLPKDVPDTLMDFQSVMVKFAVDPAWAESITDYIANTGSPLVFEDPYELLTKLIQFPQQVGGYKRNAILKYWVSTHKLHETEDYQKVLAKEQRELMGHPSDDDSEAQVQIVGGKIVPTDKSMPISQAREVLKVTGGASGDGKGTDEGKFTVDENGDPIAIPGAKLSQSEAIVLGSIKQRRAAGDNRNAFEIFTEEAGKLESFKQALGIQSGGGGGNPLSTPEGLKSLKEVFGTEEATRAMLAKMDENNAKNQENLLKLIEKMGEKPKEDPQVAELKADVATLNQNLEKEREERHKLETESLKKQIDSLSSDIKSLANGKQATDAYGIMSKGIDKLSEAGNKIADKLGDAMTRGNVIPMTTDLKRTMKSGLGAEAERALAAQRAGAKIFSAPPPPTPSPPQGPPTIPLEGV